MRAINPTHKRSAVKPKKSFGNTSFIIAEMLNVLLLLVEKISKLNADIISIKEKTSIKNMSYTAVHKT
jgi:hypothetical protein